MTVFNCSVSISFDYYERIETQCLHQENTVKLFIHTVTVIIEDSFGKVL